MVVITVQEGSVRAKAEGKIMSSTSTTKVDLANDERKKPRKITSARRIAVQRLCNIH